VIIYINGAHIIDAITDVLSSLTFFQSAGSMMLILTMLNCGSTMKTSSVINSLLHQHRTCLNRIWCTDGMGCSDWGILVSLLVWQD